MDIFNHFDQINIFVFETADNKLTAKALSQVAKLCEEDKMGAFREFNSNKARPEPEGEDLQAGSKLQFSFIPKGKVVVHECGIACVSVKLTAGNTRYEDIARAAVQICKKLQCPLMFDDLGITVAEDQETLKGLKKTSREQRVECEFYIASKNSVDEIASMLKFKCNRKWDSLLAEHVNNIAQQPRTPEQTARDYPTITMLAQKHLG